LLAAALAMLAAAPLPKRWQHWRYSRAIDVSQVTATHLASFVLPEDVYPHAQPGLADLRIIDDTGNEVPYARLSLHGSTNSAAIRAKLIENSFEPGRYTQLVVGAGRQPPFHNAVRIETRQSEFIEWVSVEASDDARNWRMVQPRAPIFRFEQEGHSGTQTVSYSENNALYLRIRILDGHKQFPISGASILHQTSQPPERAAWDISLTPEAHPPAGRTVWNADLGQGRVPVSEVRFEVPAPLEFIRSVELSSSSDRQTWSTWASGEIDRYRPGGADSRMEEKLTVPVPYLNPTGRYWRVEIFNGSDAPLEGVAVHFYVTPLHIIFEQQPGRNYQLLYGQDRAGAPNYDLPRRLDAKQELAAADVSVAAEQENSKYADPRPWSEQHQVFLWVIMGLAVVLLGYSALRSLRRSSSPASSAS
jgi:hypothetical protein